MQVERKGVKENNCPCAASNQPNITDLVILKIEISNLSFIIQNIT